MDAEPATPFPPDVIVSMEGSFNSWLTEQLAIPSFEAGGHIVASPSCIIEDYINGGTGLMKQEEHGLIVIPWWPGPAASLIAHVGNEEHGHGGRITESISAALCKQQTGAEKSPEEIFQQELTDRVICVPGLPPHYEPEQMTQLMPPILPLMCQVLSRWGKMRDHMSVVIVNSIYEMEPVAAEALAGAFTKPLTSFCVGPAVDLPPAPPAESDSTLEFLDKAYADLGPHSVIYISFGTIFFPVPESMRHLEIIIEEIVAHGFRLVFALSSMQARMDDVFIKKMIESGNAMFPGWTNQTKVLEHLAIHYFMSHGGWNSTAEAIVRDIPMIFWPFAADQPTNSLQVAKLLDCGFELVQIRTGPARAIAYPNTPITGSDAGMRNEIRNVLQMSKGARGRQQRLNTKALGKIMRKSIMNGGSGDIALGEFGKATGL
ncbi:hypothetical protein FRC10_005453 [Ceratobasidium sp. 414]|nr:hypothetical protein FRC10_005453 [Ceratobasidium sp. 414]